MFKVSCIQICSSNNIKDNIKKILYYIGISIKEKSDLILTPETCSIMSGDKKELIKKAKIMDEDELFRLRVVNKALTRENKQLKEQIRIMGEAQVNKAIKEESDATNG